MRNSLARRRSIPHGSPRSRPNRRMIPRRMNVRGAPTQSRLGSRRGIRGALHPRRRAFPPRRALPRVRRIRARIRVCTPRLHPCRISPRPPPPRNPSNIASLAWNMLRREPRMAFPSKRIQLSRRRAECQRILLLQRSPAASLGYLRTRLFVDKKVETTRPWLPNVNELATSS
jgi:hypothetical protein